MKIYKTYYVIILLFIIGGCSYSMTIEKDRDYIDSNSKIPYSIFYVDDNFKMKRIWTVSSGNFDFEIDIGETLSKNIYELLKSNFENIDKNQTKISIFKFEPDIKLFNCGENYCNSKFDLKITDLNRNVIIKQYTFNDTIDTSGGFVSTSMGILTGASLFILSPITIPVWGLNKKSIIKENLEDYIDDIIYKLQLKFKTDQYFYDTYIKNNYPSIFNLMGTEKPITM